MSELKEKKNRSGQRLSSALERSSLRPSWLRRSHQIDENIVNVFIFLPQCKQCTEFGKPKPIRVDFEDQQMTFLGSSGFLDRPYPKQEIAAPPNEEIQEDANKEQNN